MNVLFASSARTIGEEGMTVPGSATYYRSPGPTWDSPWDTGTWQVWDAGKVIKRGLTKEVWNAAVTGPSFAQPNRRRALL